MTLSNGLLCIAGIIGGLVVYASIRDGHEHGLCGICGKRQKIEGRGYCQGCYEFMTFTGVKR